MKITREEVVHVARLARLALEPTEIEALTAQLDQLLGYVAKLNELDTDAIVPTAQAVSLENAFRPDEITPPLGLEQALQNAPQSRESCFVVPKVIE